MPLPLLFLGVAAVTGAFGAGKTVKAVSDNSKADQINTIANTNVKNAKNNLNRQREEVSAALNQLGEEKLFVISHNINEFVDCFEKIKNVDFAETEGLKELKNFHVDKKDFQELKELGNFGASVVGGVTAGVTGGALTAVGAYGLAVTFASASTGTAISTLAGAAATNATLAFFGGGSLAAGGMGIAGGMAVMGSFIAGPALAVMGLITGSKAQEKIDTALSNKAESDQIVETLKTASMQCAAIRRRTYLFYNLMAHLDSYFLPLIWKMEDIVKNEGDDYRQYSAESKKIVASAASSAVAVKSVLDTPILKEDGSLTPESEEIVTKMNQLIYQQ